MTINSKILWLLGLFSGAAIISQQKKIKGMIWDEISEKRIQRLHPKVRKAALNFIADAEKQGIKLRVTSTLRTWEEQAKLYAKGRTMPGARVTNARPGYSYHNFGLALDVVEIKEGKALWINPRWQQIGLIGKKHGFKWGGDWSSFKDLPHFEMTFGNSTAMLRQRYADQGNYVTV